jgi:hypothetical protein
VIWNVQACCSCDTLAEEITESGACLVLSMSALGYGHDPDGVAASGLVVVADWLRVVADVPELVQAPVSKAARTASRLIPIPVQDRLVRFEADMALLP